MKHPFPAPSNLVEVQNTHTKKKMETRTNAQSSVSETDVSVLTR